MAAVVERILILLAAGLAGWIVGGFCAPALRRFWRGGGGAG